MVAIDDFVAVAVMPDNSVNFATPSSVRDEIPDFMS